MRPVVKICGLMRGEDVGMCVHYGTDILGFVVEYPRPVPWNIDAATARELIASASAPAKTCVVTGGDVDKITRIARTTRPDFIQLHFGESLEDTAYLIRELGKYGMGIIKTVFPDTPDLEETAKKFSAAGIFAILYDPRAPDNAKEGGAANLTVHARLSRAVKCPVILAGGIVPANVREMVRKTNAQIIDLMTGVESSHGVKDEGKVATLFEALRGI